MSGLLLCYFPFGSQVLQVAPPALTTYLAMRLAPRHCGYVAWAVCFPYLIAMCAWGLAVQSSLHDVYV